MIGLLTLGIICFGSIEFLLYTLANFGREAKRRKASSGVAFIQAAASDRASRTAELNATFVEENG
jgi:hypothetical protein